MNIPRAFRAQRLLAVAGVLTLGGLAQGAEVETKTVEASAKQMDEALAGKKVHAYTIISKDEVIDMDGRHFAPDKAKAYLKKAKPDKQAAIVFLVADDSLVDTAKSMVDAFGDYGATLFAVRRIEKGGTTIAAEGPDGAAPGQKVLKLVGTPNPQAISSKDAPPAMAGRPEYLRPGKLPPRVRYKFVADEQVVAAAAATEKLFLPPAAPDGVAPFDRATLILAGAWQHISDVPELKGTKPIISQVELDAKVVKLEGRLVSEPVQFEKSAGRIRELIAADGGGKVRALNSAEMNHWWTFIGFDIEEPVFAVETKNGQYLFIVGWVGNHVFALDELKVLP